MFAYLKCPFKDDDCHYQDEGFCHRADPESECDLFKTPETKEEALQILQNAGILDENGEIEEAFKDIIIKIGE